MTSPGFTPSPAYRQELQLLRQEGLASWEEVAALDPAQIRRLASRSPGSEARLLRLRGQAQLVVGVNLAPAEAALLLHAGIANPAGLAQADPHALHRQVGRLQRRLTGGAMAPIALAEVRRWILRAGSGPGRSGN